MNPPARIPQWTAVVAAKRGSGAIRVQTGFIQTRRNEMTRELCEICTGSYTGEFCQKWRGPWAHLFSASGEFLPFDVGSENQRAQQKARDERAADLRWQRRLPLGQMYSRYS